MDKSQNSAKDTLLQAHDGADPSDSGESRYYWLELTATRLAERIESEVGNGDDSDWRLRNRLHAVGFSLRSYHWQIPKDAEKIASAISADYRSRLAFRSYGYLCAGLPNGFEYFEHRMLSSNRDKQTVDSLEQNWTGLDTAIQSDIVLRREYAVLINRHASYIRADWHLNSLDFGIVTDKSLRNCLSIYRNIRLGLGVASCIGVATLIWLGSASGSGYLASILGVLLLGFLYTVTCRLQYPSQSRIDRAMSEILPFIRLESALDSAKSTAELDRCRNLAEKLFDQGYFEMRYVLNVLCVPPMGPRTPQP